MVDDFLILKKRRWFLVDKITCWELVAKAQMMVDAESICDIKVIIDDDSVGEGGEQKWKDVWGDLTCLQFIQTRQMPFNAIEEELLQVKKLGTKLCLEGRSIMFPKYDGA